jgi:hypothetical protein
MRAYTNSCMRCQRTNTVRNIHTRTSMGTDKRTHGHTHRHKRTNKHTHTHIHTYIHAYIHTHIHIHIRNSNMLSDMGSPQIVCARIREADARSPLSASAFKVRTVVELMQRCTQNEFES